MHVFRHVRRMHLFSAVIVTAMILTSIGLATPAAGGPPMMTTGAIGNGVPSAPPASATPTSPTTATAATRSSTTT